jgi:hypothetical protein
MRGVEAREGQSGVYRRRVESVYSCCAITCDFSVGESTHHDETITEGFSKHYKNVRLLFAI